MTRKELILKDLQDGYNSLRNALIDLKIENLENQFDYVTSPKLSDLFDNIEDVTKQLAVIIYQK